MTAAMQKKLSIFVPSSRYFSRLSLVMPNKALISISAAGSILRDCGT